MDSEIVCRKCGEACTVEGEMPKFYAWCDTCHDSAAGFDADEYARDVITAIMDSRPER